MRNQIRRIVLVAKVKLAERELVNAIKRDSGNRETIMKLDSFVEDKVRELEFFLDELNG